jgi:dTDP-4-dehydrorhamnose 3,5-epimerase
MKWDDPSFGINWPVSPAEAILSEKDRKLFGFADLPRVFG